MAETTTILLADDEYLVRKGIRHLLRNQAGFSIVADATNGREAVEKAAALQPQVIIMDVKMPSMDGLDALERIRAVSPGSKTVILSGYSSFEYAQRALKLGACDYLLKPVALEELLAVLRRAQHRLRQEKRQEESSRQMEEQLSFSMSAFIEQFYMQLLRNELPDEELAEKMRVLELENLCATVLLVGLDHSYRMRTSSTEQAYQAVLQETRALLEDVLGRGRPKCPPVLALDNAVFALVYLDSFTPAPLEFARQVLRTVQDRLRRSASIAVSSPVALADLGRAYAEASDRLKQRLLLGGGRIISDDPGTSTEIQEYPHDLERMLATAVRFGDLEQIRGVLRAIVRRLGAQNIPGDCWQQVAFDLTEQAYQVARQMSATSVTARELVEKGRELSLLTTLQDVQLWLETTLCTLAGRIRELGAGPSLAVKKALSFMERHYREDIKLAEVAAHVCLSPNYLSQQLKQQTGKSFLEHVSGWRLEEAKRLLGSSVLTVSQVAYQVGYTNPRHFSEVFQRRCGTTPSRYRKGERS